MSKVCETVFSIIEYENTFTYKYIYVYIHVFVVRWRLDREREKKKHHLFANDSRGRTPSMKNRKG